MFHSLTDEAPQFLYKLEISLIFSCVRNNENENTVRRCKPQFQLIPYNYTAVKENLPLFWLKKASRCWMKSQHFFFLIRKKNFDESFVDFSASAILSYWQNNFQSGSLVKKHKIIFKVFSVRERKHKSNTR